MKVIGGTTLDDERGLIAGAPVPSLVRWGLSPDADLLYRTLVRLGPRSGKWLARDLGMAVRRVQIAAEELLAAGAVDRSEGRTVLRPRAVEDVLAALRHTRQTRERMCQLINAERREHLSLNPERLRNTGIRSDAGDSELVVVDRRVARRPADPFDLTAGALEAGRPAMVSAGAMASIGLTPREEAIVALLAEGHTDSVVAERLGLGQRTITYSLRALMDRLGVDNRFQLGLVLGAATATTPPESDGPRGQPVVFADVRLVGP